MEYRIIKKCEFINYIDDVDELYNECFGKYLGVEYYKWKYLGKEEIWVAGCFVDNELIGFYAIVQLKIKQVGIEFNGGITLNIMTSPRYQGLGVFSELGNIACDYARSKGCKILIVFPNGISNVMFCSKLNYQVIYEIPMLEKLLINSPCDNQNIVRDDKFLLDYSLVSNLNDSIIIVKNTEYLYNRYYLSPEHNYYNYVIETNKKCLAYAVCKIYQNKINIVEIHACSDEYLKQIIEIVIYACKIKKLKCVTTWINFSRKEHQIFEKFGFINKYPIHYFTGKILDIESIDQGILDYKNWNVSLGDNNTY